MTETNYTRTVTTQNVGGTAVQQERVATNNQVEAGEFANAKLVQAVWFITHFIAIILALRFVFLLLGANMTGIVLFIYNLSVLFTLPFRGIFPSPRTGEFFFDTRALLAIIFYYLIAFIIVRALLLFSKRTDVP